MPHLVEIQKKYADKGVQIVSISDEDLETVEKFLEREFTGSTESKDGGAAEDAPKIMRSARGGRVDAALGMIDEALEAAKSAEVKQRLQMLRIQMLAQAGKSEEAIAALDAMIESSEDAAFKQQLGMFRIQMLLQDISSPKLAEGVIKAYADFKGDPSFVNFIAWTIYESMSDGTLDNDALLKASRVASEQAAEAAEGPTKAAILDTAAHFQLLDGDAQTALKTQEAAIKLADETLKEQLTEFLEEIKKALEKQSK